MAVAGARGAPEAVDGLRDAKVLVEAEQPVQPLFPVHRAMRCAWPTVPSDRDEGYDARSQSYLAGGRGFEAAPTKASRACSMDGRRSPRYREQQSW